MKRQTKSKAWSVLFNKQLILMTSPFQNADKAFKCLFTDEITFRSEDYHASVFPLEDVDPFSELDATSEIKRINVLVFKSDLSSAPEIGDALSYDDEDYKVSSVKSEQSWYRLTCRTI